MRPKAFPSTTLAKRPGPGWCARRRVSLALCLSAIALVGGARQVAAQLAGGLNASLMASPSNVAVGQVVTFTYSASPPAVAPPFASITSTMVNYGDGAAESGNSGAAGQTVSGVLTHVYSFPGTYSATLIASASNGGSGSAVSTVFVGGGGGGQTPTVTVTASPSTVPVGQPVSFNYSATTSFGIGFPSVRSMLISYGDGAPLPLNPPSGIVSHAYNSPGFYNILVTATDSNGQQGQGTASVQVNSGPAFGQPPANVQILNPSNSSANGQPVSFNAATAVALNPGAFIQSYAWNFGDGGIDNGQSVSHVFSTPGSYTVTLTVTDSTGASAQNSTSISITSGVPAPVPGVSVTYQAGWNLIAAPNGATVSGASGPLYTLQTGDTTYRTASTTQSGFGYWGYFPTVTTARIPFSGPQTFTKSLQPGQFIMIGNSSSSPAVVSGADIVYIYNATTGYQQSTTLQPGQGAWALSNGGGNITITSSGS